MEGTLPWLLRGILKEREGRKKTPEDMNWKRIYREAPAIRPVRPKLGKMGFTWESHRNLVETAGHKWCNLLRDSWACFGAKYADVLKETPEFNRSFALSELPTGTNILVHGHSHVALVVTTLICQSMAASDVEVYKIAAGKDIFNGNSLFAHLPKNNVSLLLLSNEYDQWDKVERYDTLFRFLSSWGFYPRVVLLGQVNNDGGPKPGVQRLSKLRQQFPDANTQRISSRTFRSLTCVAPQCTAVTLQSSGPSHSCTPGPVLRHAERLGDTLLQYTSSPL